MKIYTPGLKEANEQKDKTILQPFKFREMNEVLEKEESIKKSSPRRGAKKKEAIEKKATINDVVQSKTFATWLALLAIFVQSKHTFQAYLSTESVTPNWIDIAFSMAAALVLDLIILFYTLRGRIGVAKLGALILGTVNIYAYWIIHRDFTMEFFFSIVFAISLPLLVYFYSDELVHRNTKASRGKKKAQ